MCSNTLLTIAVFALISITSIICFIKKKYIVCILIAIGIVGFVGYILYNLSQLPPDYGRSHCSEAYNCKPNDEYPNYVKCNYIDAYNELQVTYCPANPNY